MTSMHKGLTIDKWNELSFDEQMGNIGSEVLRVWHSKEAGRGKESEKAFERTLELIRFSIAGGLIGGQLGEVLRLREVFCDTYLEAGEYTVTPEMINNYLLEFAIKARR